MERRYMRELVDWKDRKTRKPLVVRGARQVGKTYLIREFARAHFENLVELNFDKTPEKAGLFRERDVSSILRLLEVDSRRAVVPGRTLVFLDAIQAAPAVFPVLRYFCEDRPDIHVIAAGSLLEFLFAEHDFSMPVGRIEYLHMGGMTFEEFLLALGEERLVAFLNEWTLAREFPRGLHEKLSGYVRRFVVVGGMPSAVGAHVEADRADAAHRAQQEILQTFADDFAKYRKRVNVARLRKTFARLPALVGRKLKYVHIDRHEKARDLAVCVELLAMARVIHRVRHSAASGLPLGAEANGADFKPLFLDVGLVSSALGLTLAQVQLADDLVLVNGGALCEQYVGQHLLYQSPPYMPPDLFYWNREKRGAAAEVDYLIAGGNRVVPVEVKAGKTGSLRSLHVFVQDKGAELAVRFNTDLPSVHRVQASTAVGAARPFELVSLPLYLVEQLPRLLAGR
ncbi:MAG: ATP-binding protein [Kiritimatiellae bacterium]|nr:ATP-binding protein [Kiritimatiellia bacterium]